MINVHICPDYLDRKDAGDGGIRRVVEAMIKHLPKFGVQHVRNIDEADVIVNHGAEGIRRKGKPIVNVNHGLYWSRYSWGENYQEVNELVVESMKMAVAHTVPSEWVGRAVRRGGYFYPEVVYHGIDADDFHPSDTNQGYVLWNKARADQVSDPKDVLNIARIMPSFKFHTTIGHPTDNITVIGTTDYPHMKEIVANAGVYLCTVRETFGIGTLEALAFGIPIAGWDWGGQKEIVIQGETGYLAPPGDFPALAECIQKCFAERERLSENAIIDARERWKWEPRIQQYAEIFKRVHHDYNEVVRPKISVIVTTYNEDKYLPQCLNSLRGQTFADFECLVVDDGLHDTTKELVEEYRVHDARFKYLRPPENLGLAGARNLGFHRSRGRYLRYLDSDDFLGENALNLEASALDADPTLHIAYGHLEVVQEDGTQTLDGAGHPVRGGWPPEGFSWMQQMAHLNQLPSCAMMRREVMERSGGYRIRMKRNEDAEFWCRVTSLGFRAFKITQAVTYYHRQRENSKGAVEWKEQGAEPDWTAWFPWRIGANNYRDAQAILRRNAGRHPTPHLVPFGAQGRPDNPEVRGYRPFWYVHDYAYPVVSVIVTCGPNHRPFLIDALDSIQAQTFPDWECVVVNDTGEEWGPNIAGAPWARVVNMPGNKGVAAARNDGYKHVTGRYIVWMDADDYWMPWFLEIMVANVERNNGVICSDLIKDDNGKLSIYRYDDFVPERVPRGMQYPGSSILMPRTITDAVIKAQGGYDTNAPGMEDWDYQVCVHSLGFCAYHVDEPLFVYRTHTSTKRDADYAKIESIREFMDRKWYKYRKGQEKIMCGCSPQKKVVNIPNSTLTSSGNFADQTGVNQGVIPTQMVQVEYLGPIEETFTIRSRISRDVMYRFGQTPDYRDRTVYLQDAEFLVGLMDQFGNPLYRQITTTAMMEKRDPAAFIGQPVVA